MSMLAHEYNILIDKVVRYYGHGRYAVDVLTAIDKSLISMLIQIVQIPGTEGHGTQMFHFLYRHVLDTVVILEE